MWAKDQWKTSFRSQLGQFEWNMVLFGLQGSSSLLMRVMNQALTVGLDFPGGSTARPMPADIARASRPAPAGPHPYPWGVPGLRAHWACARSCIWTTVWYTRPFWNSTCSTWLRYSLHI